MVLSTTQIGLRAQAGINAKAETVDDLQGRRKRLHIGMCKLAREDLSVRIDLTLADFKVSEHELRRNNQSSL